MPLRRRLYLLAAAAIVPLALMSGASVLLLVQQQRHQAERAALDLTRAMMTAVDADLQRSVSALDVLATSAALDAGNLPEFQRSSERAVATQPGWMLVNLVDPSGRMLLNTGVPAEGEMPQLAERESFDQVLRTRQPVVGRLARGPLGNFALPVRVPVIRDGRLVYVLTAVLRPEAISRVVQRQRLPDEWVVSVFDSHGTCVARSRGGERFVGGAAASSLQQLMADGQLEGAGITTTLEGDESYSAYTRSPSNGWAVAIGVPVASVYGATYRSFFVYGGGLLLSLLIGLAAALWVARGILRAARDLRSAAEAIGEGRAPQTPQVSILELQAVADALTGSAAQQRSGEAERARLYAEAQAARQHAEGANRTKDEFLAMLGHELRNPLAPIVTALRLMSLRNPEAHQAERRILERQVAHLTRLVDDLLDVSRFARGKVQLRRELLDIRDVANRAVEMVQPLYDQRDTPLKVELPPQPVYVSGDPVRLAQVISNLLSNAAKFTPARGRIALSIRTDGAHVEVSVEDSGAGIGPDLLPRVFDLFVQGQQALDRQAGGLGLGLAIVKTLVELHGGSVRAESEGEGHGSRFTVRLPRAAAVTAVAGAAPPAPVATADGRRILVVDDNHDAAETLARLLDSFGHAVRTAATGPQALAMLNEFRPELAILDIGLPGMDGYELARRLKADPRMEGLRMIALTGYGHDVDRARALAAGFDEHLVKPVPVDQLMASIGRVAGKAAAPQEPTATSRADGA
jgi:signal transduction histidine kinase/ActR/RegA family two-component response regulator